MEHIETTNHLDNPPIIVRMIETYRLAPETATLALPREVSLKLIAMRKAVPVANFNAEADLEVTTEEELKTLKLAHLLSDREHHG